MAQERSQEASSSSIPLAQPQKTGPGPGHKTLLDFASERGILDPAKQEPKISELPAGAVPIRPSEEQPAPEEQTGRLGDAVLWSLSLTMLHFTFDVLTQNQYAEEISWPSLVQRSFQAFWVIAVLFYSLHPHPEPSSLIPTIPPALHQLIFFVGSLAAGCHIIYVTNEYSYYAVLKSAPPLGVLWIWSVIELNLVWSLASLLGCAAFLWHGSYSYM